MCGKPARFINIKKGFDTVCSNVCKKEYGIPEITLDYIKSLLIKIYGGQKNGKNIFYVRFKKTHLHC